MRRNDRADELITCSYQTYSNEVIVARSPRAYLCEERNNIICTAQHYISH